MKMVQERKGTLVFLLLFTPFFSSCTTPFNKIPERFEAQESLERADELLLRGEYASARTESQKALRQFPEAPIADRALFTLGILYADDRNPEMDYRQSTAYMARLIKEYPRDIFAARARVWLQLLQQNQKLHQERAGLTKEVQKLKDILQQAKEVDLEIEKKRRNITK